MNLTKDNFKLFAAAHYDNPMCLSEDEFHEDLKQLRTVRRMMTRYVNGEESSVRLLVNNVIIFYNCFKHHAATEMIGFQLDENQIGHFNAILKFLSLPMLIPPDHVCQEFYTVIEEEFK
jgi:hypothetical protein